MRFIRGIIALDQQLAQPQILRLDLLQTPNLIDVEVSEPFAPSVDALFAHAMTFGDLTDRLPAKFERSVLRYIGSFSSLP
jgi:hypothetical protein